MRIHDNVLKFNCEYQQNGQSSTNYNWAGYIIRKDNPFDLSKSSGFISSLIGTTVDYQVTQVERTYIVDFKKEIVPYEDKRVLCGQYGMRHVDNTVEFVIFPKQGRPIDYEFMYDEIDNCFYGVWYFVDEGVKENFKYEGFAKLEIEEGIKTKKEPSKSEENQTVIDENYIENDVETCEAYEKYCDKIYELMCKEKPILQVHDKESQDRFRLAKAYFRGRSRNRQDEQKTGNN